LIFREQTIAHQLTKHLQNPNALHLTFLDKRRYYKYQMLESQGFPTMAGLVVFRSLSEALRAGFQIYDRTADGYLVRTQTSTGWAMALVNLKP